MVRRGTMVFRAIVARVRAVRRGPCVASTFFLALVAAVSRSGRADEVGTTLPQDSPEVSDRREAPHLDAARADSSEAEQRRVAGTARDLLARSLVSEAIDALKRALRETPDSLELRWLLVRAYLDDRNESWALRTLAAIAELAPEDCEPLLWIAWIHIGQGALESARDELQSSSCAPHTPSNTRRSILLAFLENVAGKREVAQKHLAEAQHASVAFPEDRETIDALATSVEPGYLPPLSAKIDFATGLVTNARAGSPSDPATSRAALSSAAQLGASLRFVPPMHGALRPSLELESRALGFGAALGRDYSYLTVGARAGVVLGGTMPNGLLAYHTESLLLGRGDRYDAGPLWYYAAHRAELELNILPKLSLFGGVGRRLFREYGRSRNELDGGVGTGIAAARWLRLLGAALGRWHGADKAPYDLVGASALISAEATTHAQWSLRAALSAALDLYPHSAGYFDALAPDADRRDFLVRMSWSAFAPPALGTRTGLTYDYSRRVSTAAPYEYDDHRVLLKLAWHFHMNPWAPHSAARGVLPVLDYHLSTSEFDDRLQDLLRRDEATQRSSSCLK